MPTGGTALQQHLLRCSEHSAVERNQTAHGGYVVCWGAAMLRNSQEPDMDKHLFHQLKRLPRDRWLAAASCLVAVLMLALWALTVSPARGYAPARHPAAVAAQPAPSTPTLRPSFGAYVPTALARQVTEHLLASNDHGARPFFVVDKHAARLLVFDAQGRLQADSPVLLGSAIGDDSVPGIGERKIADIRPFERTTPAGRFVSEAGRNAAGEDIIWVDYEDAISMHRVRLNNPRERRAQRLASPTIADNRISYGCINVPAEFYNRWVSPAFQHGKAVVYVLPDQKTERQVFNWPGLAEVLPAPGQQASI